jgi:zinc D-Ala-D-Ala carboxypeptidase
MTRRLSLFAGLLALGLSACARAPDAVIAAEAPPAPVTQESAAAVPTPGPPAPVAAIDTSQAEAGTPDWLSLRYLIGDVDPTRDPRFKRVPSRMAGREGLYGQVEAVEALTSMAEAAKLDGVNLKVVSAFRSFDDQKRIWENKWDGTTRVEGGALPQTVPDPRARALKILEFSSMPATSRHHWGTDFDLNNLTNEWFDAGEGKQVYDWLAANAARYGFCQTYTKKGPDRPDGYSEERWHWSYTPLSGPMLAAYPDMAGYEHVTGFLGSGTAREIDVIGKYVQGVNPQCQTR